MITDKNHVLLRIALTILFVTLAGPAQACTAFLLKDNNQYVVARNYDWDIDDGLVLVNKRDIAKFTLEDTNPARWVSRYGSITFNQYGREQPVDGMNESGLVVCALWLEPSKHPDPGKRSRLNGLQWVQYQLDNFASVRDVLANDTALAISSGAGSQLHYFLADRTGDCASIEFIDGKAVYHTGKDMPVPVLANNTYAESEESLHRFTPWGGKQRVRQDFSSLARFVRAAYYVKAFDPADSVGLVDYAFDALTATSSGMYTRWNIAYDPTSRRIWFRTRHNQQLRSVDLSTHDFSGSKPVQMLNMNTRLSGTVDPAFEDYRVEANQALIHRVFGQIEFLKAIPDSQLDRIATYPDSFRYVGK